MAITVVSTPDNFRSNSGQTDGNEVIFKLNPLNTYVVNCINTSAGTATLKLSTSRGVPTDFTNFTNAYDGTQNINFAREIRGCSYVGLDIASSGGGTWTVEVSLAS